MIKLNEFYFIIILQNIESIIKYLYIFTTFSLSQLILIHNTLGTLIV